MQRTAHLVQAYLQDLIAACGRSDETLGQKVDGAVSQTKEAAQQASSQAAASVEKTLEKTSEVMKQDSAKATSMLDDAAITTSITAGLAKDPDLSALKIDVDTKAGKVSLHGSAPVRKRVTVPSPSHNLSKV